MVAGVAESGGPKNTSDIGGFVSFLRCVFGHLMFTKEHRLVGMLLLLPCRIIT